MHGVAWEHCATSYMELLWQLGPARHEGLGVEGLGVEGLGVLGLGFRGLWFRV